MLPAFFAYYRALGVCRHYIYLDRPTDGSEEIVRSVHDAEAIVRDRASGHDLTTHQLACADDALARARADGIDWLLHIDIDEFAFGDNPGADVLERGSLVHLLQRARPSTEAVMLRTLEVVPRARFEGAPFWQLHDVQDGGVLERDLLDPNSGRTTRLARLIGHDLGKSAVRVAADVRAGTPHAWTRRHDVPRSELEPIPTEHMGVHFHFVVQGAVQWRDKYLKVAEDPAHWPRGAPVPFPRQAWKEAVARLSRVDAEQYARDWVLVGDEEIERGYRSGVLRSASEVEAVLRAVGFIAS